MLKQYELGRKEDNLVCLNIINTIDTEDINPFTNDEFEIMSILKDYLHIGDLKEEHLYIISQDDFNRITGIFLAGIGENSKVESDYNRILTFLLLIGASKCIQVHNHPIDIETGKGVLEPSDGDKKNALVFRTKCNMFNIISNGSYIITNDGYYNIENKEQILFLGDE